MNVCVDGKLCQIYINWAAGRLGKARRRVARNLDTCYGDVMKELEEFKRSLRALALELHPLIHADVAKKFQALEDEVEKLGDEAIAAEQRIQTLETEVQALTDEKRGNADMDALLQAKMKELYVDRNLIVALLLRMCASNRWRVGTMPASDAMNGFSRVAVIDSPEGQLSWHFPDSEQGLFDTLDKVFGAFPEPWDGHTTEQKFERIRKIIAKIDEINTHMLGEKVAAKVAGN